MTTTLSTHYSRMTPCFQEDTALSAAHPYIKPLISLVVPQDLHLCTTTASPVAEQPTLSPQDQLREHCSTLGLGSPKFEDVVDVQYGQSAFTSRVIIQGQIIKASSWYGSDSHLEYARNDAAEAALRKLGVRRRRRAYIMS